MDVLAEQTQMTTWSTYKQTITLTSKRKVDDGAHLHVQNHSLYFKDDVTLAGSNKAAQIPRSPELHP